MIFGATSLSLEKPAGNSELIAEKFMKTAQIANPIFLSLIILKELQAGEVKIRNLTFSAPMISRPLYGI